MSLATAPVLVILISEDKTKVNMDGRRREGRSLPPHLQSAMDAGELAIYRNFLAGQPNDRLKELYTQAWNDCKPRNVGLPNARAIQQLVQVWKVMKER